MFIKKFNKLLPFKVISKNKYKFINRDNRFKKWKIYNSFNTKDKKIFSNDFINYSFSQLGQDFIALALSEVKKSGFFVEFGACDGMRHSNTFSLEKVFNWNVILAEPAKIWRDSLLLNRNCLIDTRCVYSKSNSKLPFLEVKKDKNISYGASSLLEFANNGDWASNLRLKNNNQYEVKTISLNDLLEEYNAPKKIDFMSIDTEGSELEIIEKFNFEKYKIRFLCIEHNFVNPIKKKLDLILKKNGYRQIYKKFSEFDYWYVYDNF